MYPFPSSLLRPTILVGLLSTSLVVGIQWVQAGPAELLANRYLEVRSMTGIVIYQNARRRLRAWSGLRLRSAGELIETDRNSRAILAIDGKLDVINISENTQLLVRKLAISGRGGYVTQIQILRGQVNVKSSQFVNRDSRLELYTPTGIVGVRGTEFGIGVQPMKRTGVATLSGKVAVRAQNKSVLVHPGEQSVINPNEPPQPARPLNNNPQLYLEESQVIEASVRLTGRIDPSHLLTIDGVPQSTDRDGFFTLTRPIANRSIMLLHVSTPLGEYRNYELPLQ